MRCACATSSPAIRWRSCRISAARRQAAASTLRRSRSPRAWLDGARETGPDLLVANRFGRLESEGGGMLAEIGRAFADGLPLIVCVPKRYLNAWDAFADRPRRETAADAGRDRRLVGRPSSIRAVSGRRGGVRARQERDPKNWMSVFRFSPSSQHRDSVARRVSPMSVQIKASSAPGTSATPRAESSRDARALRMTCSSGSSILAI